MKSANMKQNSKHNEIREDIIRKTNMYKDTAINAMKNVSEFDSKVIDSNDEYLERLLQADKSEYDILKENMEKAETAEERQSIRDRMAEMKKKGIKKIQRINLFMKSNRQIIRIIRCKCLLLWLS